MLIFLGYLIILLLLLVVLLNFAWAGFSAAPWVPSLKKDLIRVKELAEVKEGDVVMDLGSGDGRWLFYLAKNSPAKELHGYEISLLMYATAWIIKLFGRYPQVHLHCQSLYRADLSRADVVLCFLLPKTVKRLLPKFEQSMKNGSRLISYAFSLPDKTPINTSKNKESDISIYLYKF